MRRSVAVFFVLLLIGCGGSSKRATTEQTVVIAPTTAHAPAPTPTASSVSPTADVAEAATATAPAPATATVARPSATATRAATATPKPSPTSAVKADLQVGKWMLRPDGVGDVYVDGEVTNGGSGDAQNVQVAITLLDANGTILDSANALSVLPIIATGETSPFTALFDNVDPSQVANTKFQVQFEAYDPSSFFAQEYSTNLSITQVNWANGKITGEVKNDGSRAVTLPDVLVIGYDASGNIVQVEDVIANLQELDPGASAPFSEDLFTDAADPVTIKAVAYALTQ